MLLYNVINYTFNFIFVKNDEITDFEYLHNWIVNWSSDKVSGNSTRISFDSVSGSLCINSHCYWNFTTVNNLKNTAIQSI